MSRVTCTPAKAPLRLSDIYVHPSMSNHIHVLEQHGCIGEKRARVVNLTHPTVQICNALNSFGAQQTVKPRMIYLY